MLSALCCNIVLVECLFLLVGTSCVYPCCAHFAPEDPSVATGTEEVWGEGGEGGGERVT